MARERVAIGAAGPAPWGRSQERIPSLADSREAGMTRQGRTLRWNRLGRLTVLAAVALVMTALPAGAAVKSPVVSLPGATSAEGIAGGRGSTFYAGDLFAGNIYRGDLQHGTASLLIHAPANRM